MVACWFLAGEEIATEFLSLKIGERKLGTPAKKYNIGVWDFEADSKLSVFLFFDQLTMSR